MNADWIGWLATVLFAVSYFCRKPTTLRRVQGVGALTWMTYGALIHSLPVVVANIIVASVAFWSFARPRRGATTPESTLEAAPPDRGATRHWCRLGAAPSSPPNARLTGPHSPRRR